MTREQFNGTELVTVQEQVTSEREPWTTVSGFGIVRDENSVVVISVDSKSIVVGTTESSLSNTPTLQHS